MPPRAPRWPASEIRTSYQVGKPWMFDGKILRGEIGTPIRRMARPNSSLALAEPEPLTLAKRTTKSFTLLIVSLLGMYLPHASCRLDISACPRRRSDSVQHTVRSAGRHLHPSPSPGRSSV